MSGKYTNKKDKITESLDWFCKAAVRESEMAFIKIRDLSANDAVKTQFEVRLSIYFSEIYDKTDRTAKEDRILGLFFYVGLCCLKNMKIAKEYWAEGTQKGDSRCRLLQKDSILEAIFR